MPQKSPPWRTLARSAPSAARSVVSLACSADCTPAWLGRRRNRGAYGRLFTELGLLTRPSTCPSRTLSIPRPRPRMLAAQAAPSGPTVNREPSSDGPPRHVLSGGSGSTGRPDRRSDHVQ